MSDRISLDAMRERRAFDYGEAHDQDHIDALVEAVEAAHAYLEDDWPPQGGDNPQAERLRAAFARFDLEVPA